MIVFVKQSLYELAWAWFLAKFKVQGCWDVESHAGHTVFICKKCFYLFRPHFILEDNNGGECNMASISTRMQTTFIHAMAFFILFFFAGLLIEASLKVMGALTAYGLAQWTIPTLMGAIMFFFALANGWSQAVADQNGK